MNKGKRRCGACSWFVGKLRKENEGICGYYDGRVGVDDGYAVKCNHFKGRSYAREKRIPVHLVDTEF